MDPNPKCAMKAGQKPNLERIIESAIAANWTDLMRGGPSGLIHVEYGFVPDGTLDYLQVWTSQNRGYWLLACSYWMSASKLHGQGVHFDNGYQSTGLARILEMVMQRQDAFALPRNFGRRGLIGITTPTEEESTAAAAWMSDAIGRISSALGEPLLATG